MPLTQRIIADIIILVSLFLLPWWLVVIFGLFATYFFDTYYEIIFFGFIYDTLYAPPTLLWRFMFTIVAYFIFIFFYLIKKQIRI